MIKKREEKLVYLRSPCIQGYSLDITNCGQNILIKHVFFFPSLNYAQDVNIIMNVYEGLFR